MIVKANHLEIAAVALLSLCSLWLWTLPIQGTAMPFGDVDASSHFTIGDYMVASGWSVLETPYHIKFRYGGQNSAFPEYLWYPPQYWTNTALAQVFGGERLLPFFILIAFFCSLIVFSSYFLMRSLFGAWVAFLSSFLLIFSTRDYMIYLWGQWPQSLSFAFTPIVLYCAYNLYLCHKEQDSTDAKRKKILYASLLGVFLAGQFFFHPQGMIASIGAISVFGVFLLIRDRKMPFSWKESALALGILIAVVLLFAPFNVGEFVIELTQGEGEQSQGLQVSKLFHWYQGIKNDPGLPDFYFTYNQTHGSLDGGIWSWWTLPFLLIGVATLMIRRKPQDLLLLGWLVSFYFLTRLSVIGMGSRDIRMFAYEAHVFYPLIAIGLLALPSFLAQGSARQGAKYFLIALFIALAISINGASAYEVLKSQQNSIGRINPYQYGAAEWIRNNLPYETDIYDFGTLGFQNYAAKIKWMGVLSQRHFIVNDGEEDTIDYVIVDYTDAMLLNNQEYLSAIGQFETQFQNATPLYDQDNIRVYKVGTADN